MVAPSASSPRIRLPPLTSVPTMMDGHQRRQGQEYGDRVSIGVKATTSDGHGHGLSLLSGDRQARAEHFDRDMGMDRDIDRNRNLTQ